jgi:hypothetical protein
MLPDFPPGIPFLFSRIFEASVLPATIYVLGVFARNQMRFDVSPWLVAITAILSSPLSIAVSISWRAFSDRWNAHSKGAVLPPMVPSKRFGGLDLLAALAENIKSGYLGEL